MIVKKLSLLISILLLSIISINFVTPKISLADTLQEEITKDDSIFTKIFEGIEYFFAFRIENKVAVLEKQAERRLVKAQEYAQEGDGVKIQSQLQSYLRIKERQDTLLEKTSDEDILGAVAERTVEQQKTMEEIKTQVETDVVQNVIQVQEQVVNQVAKRVVVQNGPEGATEFFQQVEHVWAPGTGPGEGGSSGEAGVVIEGGEMKFAPGTSGGGEGRKIIEGNVVVEGEVGEGNNGNMEMNEVN